MNARTLGTFETRLAVPATAGGIDLRAAAAGSGEFEGYACRWNVTDSFGTRFVPGCFTAGELDERLYALLWMHDPNQPGATFTARETDDGLWIEGAYDETQLGQDMRARAKSGSAPELSVGFVWRDSDPDDENAITNARLVETSQITARMASVPGAQISAVRAASLGGEQLEDAVLVHEDTDVRGALHLAAARARLLDHAIGNGIVLS
jgi:HK97 family phage prohead protease